jgi:hypothetical protein
VNQHQRLALCLMGDDSPKRAAAKAIEDRKAAQAVAKCAEQKDPIPEAQCQQPAGPPRLGLAGVKAAALKRRQVQLEPAE